MIPSNMLFIVESFNVCCCTQFFFSRNEWKIPAIDIFQQGMKYPSSGVQWIAAIFANRNKEATELNSVPGQHGWGSNKMKFSAL